MRCKRTILFFCFSWVYSKTFLVAWDLILFFAVYAYVPEVNRKYY